MKALPTIIKDIRGARRRGRIALGWKVSGQPLRETTIPHPWCFRVAFNSHNKPGTWLVSFDTAHGGTWSFFLSYDVGERVDTDLLWGHDEDDELGALEDMERRRVFQEPVMARCSAGVAPSTALYVLIRSRHAPPYV